LRTYPIDVEAVERARPGGEVEIRP
jgi:hypothetical protein